MVKTVNLYSFSRTMGELRFASSRNCSLEREENRVVTIAMEKQIFTLYGEIGRDFDPKICTMLLPFTAN